jgi:3-methyladenine DNA glycosylase AlkD
VKVPELRKLAKEVGKDHPLAQELWATRIAEARILAAMVDVPEQVTEEQMEAWVREFDSWDVCDQVCMNLFDKTPLAWHKVRDWAEREEQYVKRAAFALLACLAWHDKQAGDERFTALLPVIRTGATDGRNYVKKAVSWALRNIGKRNPRLNRVALQVAEELANTDSRSARWIARDALRDLTSEATRRRLAKIRA